jgi:hypothetical protein
MRSGWNTIEVANDQVEITRSGTRAIEGFGAWCRRKNDGVEEGEYDRCIPRYNPVSVCESPGYWNEFDRGKEQIMTVHRVHSTPSTALSPPITSTMPPSHPRIRDSKGGSFHCSGQNSPKSCHRASTRLLISQEIHFGNMNCMVYPLNSRTNAHFPTGIGDIHISFSTCSKRVATAFNTRLIAFGSNMFGTYCDFGTLTVRPSH